MNALMDAIAPRFSSSQRRSRSAATIAGKGCSGVSGTLTPRCSESGEQQIERGNDFVALGGDRAEGLAQRRLAHRDDLLGDECEWLAVHDHARIEAVRIRARGGKFEWRHHHRIESAREKIALQGDEERLPIPALREWIGDHVELV